MYVLEELNEVLITGDVSEVVHKEKKKKRKVESSAETADASGMHAVDIFLPSLTHVSR